MEQLNKDSFNKVVAIDKHSNESSISHSGNSNVDVIINIDTKPIAYAMLCSLLATKQISMKDFELAVNKLDELTNDKKIYSGLENKVTRVKTFNERRKKS